MNDLNFTADSLREEQNKKECRSMYEVHLELTLNEILVASENGASSVRVNFMRNTDVVLRIKSELKKRNFKCTKTRSQESRDGSYLSFEISW